MKYRTVAALWFLALGAGGCAGMGRNTADDSIAAAQRRTATPPAVSFTQADLNGDARISREEFDVWLRQFGATTASAQAAAGGTARQESFDAADANHNGVLTLDEWQAMMSPANTAAGATRGTSAGAR